MSRHVLKVNRASNGHAQPAQIARCGDIEWDGASGFECTITIPAPMKSKVLRYDEYIDNMEMYGYGDVRKEYRDT